MALTTGTGSGTQTTTQSPQTAGAPANASGTPTSSVQPGTPEAVLNSSTGIQLHSAQLSTVSLTNTTSTSTTTAPTAPVQQHHTNPVLASIAVILFVLAIAWFWFTSRSEKNTTD